MSRVRIAVVRRSIRRIRVSAGVTRWLLYATATAGLVASARYAIAPPRPESPRAAVVHERDAAAEGFASLLARHYLTFDGNHPDRRAAQLAGFAGDELDPGLGLSAPPGLRQRVFWTEVVGARPAHDGSRVYTVAAQTDRAGLLYLTVDVARDADRQLRLDGYPALVGAPLTASATSGEDLHLRAVDDPALSTTCRRALRNYLAGAADNLNADLTADAAVALPGPRLALRRMTGLLWEPDHASVLASVVADDHDGVTYTLRYELDVRHVDGRWAIAAIQTDPTR